MELDALLRSQVGEIEKELDKLINTAIETGVTKADDGYPIPQVYVTEKEFQIKINDYFIQSNGKIKVSKDDWEKYFDKGEFKSAIFYQTGFLVIEKENKYFIKMFEEADENAPIFGIIKKNNKVYLLKFKEWE